MSDLERVRNKLRDTSDNLRVDAIKELARMGGAEARKLLERACNDPNVAVRYYAKRAIKTLDRGSPIAVDPPEVELAAISGISDLRVAVEDPDELNASGPERDVILVQNPPSVSSDGTGPRKPLTAPLKKLKRPTAAAAPKPPTPEAAPKPPTPESQSATPPVPVPFELASLLSGPTMPVDGVKAKHKRRRSTKKVLSVKPVKPVKAELEESRTKRLDRREVLRPRAAPKPPTPEAAPTPPTPKSQAPAAPVPPVSPKPVVELEDSSVRNLYGPPRRRELLRLRKAGLSLLRPCAELLIELLDSPDEDVCASAAEALGALGVKHARRRLVELLKAGFISHQLITALAQLRDESCVGSFIKLFGMPQGEPFKHTLVKALCKLPGEQAYDFVLSALEDPDLSVQTSLIRHIGESDDARFVHKLLGKLGTMEEYFEFAVLGALIKFASTEPSVGKAVRALLPRSKNPRKVSMLLSAVSASGNAELIDVVEPYLSDRDRRVRANAVEAVARLELTVERKAKLLEPLLEDKDNRVRANAALMLAEGGDRKAQKILNGMVVDSSKWYRASACFALGKLNTSQSVQLVARALRDPDSDVRLNAAKALREVDNPKIINRLGAGLADSNIWVRMYVVESLGSIATPAAYSRLLSHLKQEDNNQVLAALLLALAQASTDPDATVDILQPFLEHESEKVRLAAVEALEWVLSPESLSVLILCLRDLDEDVRRAAVKVIWKFGEFKIAASLYGMLKQGGREAKLSAAHILTGLGGLYRCLMTEKNTGFLLAALRQHQSYKKGNSA